jgi:hypothetical protein
MIFLIYQLWQGLFSAARSGQKLPILTILVTMIQPLLNYILTLYLQHHYDGTNNQLDNHNSSTVTQIMPIQHALSKIQSYNILLLQLNVILFLIPGYTLLFHLYHHSITTIFNKNIPNTYSKCIPSWNVHLYLLKPLEILFRYLTYRWRVLPDIIVLGEVRCGTTSFCQQLATAFHETEEDDREKMEEEEEEENDDDECQYIIDCHTPFCLWSHPELDHKETFYFVGHYLQMVTPKYYRMCFPLYLTKIWNESIHHYYSSFLSLFQSKRRKRKKRRVFMTFDGCAQYLTSPTTPYLIAQAYKEVNQPPPVMIACIRDPIDQTLSWWKYENNAQEWGEQMGLTDFNSRLRGDNYPPKSIEEALAYTQSQFVSDAYKKAEGIFQNMYDCGDDQDCTKSSSDHHVYLHSWAMTWPCGQLTGIGRNGKFQENINRYEKVFGEIFGAFKDDKCRQNSGSYGTIQNENDSHNNSFVHVLPLESLSDEAQLRKFMAKILRHVASKKKKDIERRNFEDAIRHFELSKKKLSNVHRNASSSDQVSKTKNTVDSKTMEVLQKYFVS